MKRVLLALMVVAVFAGHVSASISIKPTDGELDLTRWEGNETAQPGIDAVIAGIIGSSVELYKSDFDDGVDSGLLAGSYNTVFSPESNPTAATISWVGPGYVGPTAYLLVKGGASEPAWYLFDLTTLFNWDGQTTLELTGFWENGSNSISHVTLYGTAQAIPEPASLAIWALIAAGGAAAARKRRGRWSKANREAILEIIQKN